MSRSYASHHVSYGSMENADFERYQQRPVDLQYQAAYSPNSNQPNDEDPEDREEDLTKIMNDPLTNLIHLQMANGSFKFGKALQTYIGITENQLIEKCPENEDANTWITALAVAVLEKKFSNDKELWELISNKARKYVKEHGKISPDDIILKAHKFMSHNLVI